MGLDLFKPWVYHFTWRYLNLFRGFPGHSKTILTSWCQSPPWANQSTNAKLRFFSHQIGHSTTKAARTNALRTLARSIRRNGLPGNKKKGFVIFFLRKDTRNTMFAGSRDVRGEGRLVDVVVVMYLFKWISISLFLFLSSHAYVYVCMYAHHTHTVLQWSSQLVTYSLASRE